MSEMRVGEADPALIRRIMDRLVKEFEKIASEEVALDPSGEGLRYIDALMGCHNFYKRIILDIEARADDGKTRLWRNIALATFNKAMAEQKPYTKEGGNACD